MTRLVPEVAGTSPGFLIPEFYNLGGGGGGSGPQWYSGPGLPSNSLGADGDFYIRTSTGDVYRKAGGSWF